GERFLDKSSWIVCATGRAASFLLVCAVALPEIEAASAPSASRPAARNLKRARMPPSLVCPAEPCVAEGKHHFTAKIAHSGAAVLVPSLQGGDGTGCCSAVRFAHPADTVLSKATRKCSARGSMAQTAKKELWFRCGRYFLRTVRREDASDRWASWLS